MTIPLTKILTISARDYCEMYGKSLADYEAVGVHAEADVKKSGLKNLLELRKNPRQFSGEMNCV
jgi:hypothetical protein